MTNKPQITAENWQAIWASSVNGLIQDHVAQEILSRLGTEYKGDGTERTKFGVSVQIGTAFGTDRDGTLLRNEPVIKLVNAFRDAGRPVDGFSLVTLPKADGVVASAVRKEGWKFIPAPENFLRGLKDRAHGDRRLKEMFIGDAIGWTPQEADTVQRSHVAVLKTQFADKWRAQPKSGL